jgi:hypothetical protein
MTKIYKMIQTKEELFLAELGINTKEEIEFAYGAKIKITDLLKKYETKQLLIHVVMPSACNYYVSGMDTNMNCINCKEPKHMH